MSIIKQEYGSFTDVETQQMLAPILYSLIADRDFAIGDLFIFQNKLYKAIKAISTTDPIVIGDGTDPSDNATAASTVAEESARNDMTVVASANITSGMTYKQALQALKDNGGQALWDAVIKHGNTMCLIIKDTTFGTLSYGVSSACFSFVSASAAAVYTNFYKIDQSSSNNHIYCYSTITYPSSASQANGTTDQVSTAFLGTWKIVY